MKFLQAAAALFSSFSFASAAQTCANNNQNCDYCDLCLELTAQKDANGCIDSVSARIKGQDLTFLPPASLVCETNAEQLKPMTRDNANRYTYFYGVTGDLTLNFVMDNENSLEAATVHNVVDGDAAVLMVIPAAGVDTGALNVLVQSPPEMFIPPPPLTTEGGDELGFENHELYDCGHNRTLEQEPFSTIDIMFVWTHQAECELVKEGNNAILCPDKSVLNENTRRAMDLHVRLTVFQTNIAFLNSAVHARLNLVDAHRDETYAEFETPSGDMTFNALNDITCQNDGSSSLGSGQPFYWCYNLPKPFSGAFDDLFQRREDIGADMVALLTKDAGGQAHLGPDRDLMYSVSGWKYAATTFLLAHELGHNFGCNHDRGQENACDTVASPGFNFGYKGQGNTLKTIMSYACLGVTGYESFTGNNCPGVDNMKRCPLVQHYSSSTEVTAWNNEKTGDSNNDCARRINSVRTIIANFYPSVPLSCGNGVCDVSNGEGCDLCSSDCFFPTNCNYLLNVSFRLYINPSVYGIVFDVTVGSSDLYFYDLGVIIDQSTTAKVFMKAGPHTSDDNLLNWTKVFDGTISPNNFRASLNFSSSRFYAPAGSIIAFYLSFGLDSTYAFTRDEDFWNDDISVQSATLLSEQLGSTLPAAVSSGANFAEVIHYDYVPASTPGPVATSTSAPSPNTSTNPTQELSTTPSASFSSAPSAALSSIPSKELSSAPSVSTLNPTPNPRIVCESIYPTEYILPAKFGKSSYCYRIQVKERGNVYVDKGDKGCKKFNSGNTFNGAAISTYKRTKHGGEAIYEGVWSGLIALREDPSLSEAKLEVSGDTGSKTFSGVLTVPACSTRSVCESISPSTYILPARFGSKNYCYKLQVVDGGKMLINKQDIGCVNSNAGGGFKGSIISSYKRTDSGGEVIYEGKWNGSIALVQDSLSSEAMLEISGDVNTKTFFGTLAVPSCGNER